MPIGQEPKRLLLNVANGNGFTRSIEVRSFAEIRRLVSQIYNKPETEFIELVFGNESEGWDLLDLNQLLGH